MALPLKDELAEFLKVHTTLTLATVGNEGFPWAVALFYAERNDFSLIFASEPRVLHSRHVEAEPRVSVTIAADQQAWQEIEGLQLVGACRRVPPGEVDGAWDTYAAKFPFVMENDQLSQRLRSGGFYRIVPTWIRLIDNRRGFGFKQEFTP